MPQTLSLQFYNNDFSNFESINIDSLSDYVRQNDNLKIEIEEKEKTLFVFNDDKNEWFPLLWLQNDNYSINEEPIFRLNLYYDLVKVAEYLKATIISSDNYVLYTPAYGLLYDPEEKINLEIELGELIETSLKTQNVLLAVQEIQKIKKVKVLTNQTKI